MYGCNTIMNSIVTCPNTYLVPVISFVISILILMWTEPTHWFKIPLLVQKRFAQILFVASYPFVSPTCTVSLKLPFLPKSMYNDLLFITILSCCFYGCHHLGELILKNGKDEFHWQKIIECGSLIFGVDHISYCLPYHKTDHFYHGTTVLFSPQEVADPVALL